MGVIYTTELFDAWHDGLRDECAKAAIRVRLRRAEAGNFGDCAPVGEGMSEMRIHHGPGYRVYFKRTGMEVVILLRAATRARRRKTSGWH